jgi:hypothetical protein
MKNPLVWIAVCGLALSATLLVSAAIMSADASRDRTIIERQLTWSADDEISINAPAEVTYSYSDKPSVTVRGEAYVVNRLEMEDGEIKLNRRTRNVEKLEITLAGPAIKKFSVKGAAQLTLKDLKQDELEVSIAGAGEIKANGDVRKVEVSIAGASEVDFSDLKVADAHVSISGLGDVRIAPSESADVSIAGAGDVKLLTRPKRLSTHIAGAGNVSQPDEEEPPAVAPVPPAVPKMPPPPRMPATPLNPPKLPQQ